MHNRTKPTVGASLTQLMSAIKKESGTEITVTENGAEILWELLRVHCDERSISKATAAIATLQSLGAYFV